MTPGRPSVLAWTSADSCMLKRLTGSPPEVFSDEMCHTGEVELLQGALRSFVEQAVRWWQSQKTTTRWSAMEGVTGSLRWICRRRLSVLVM